MSKKNIRQFIKQCESEQRKNLGREKVDQKFIDQTVDKIVRTIKVQKSQVKKPLIIGMVGLVGSGKTTVARELAKKLKAVVVRNDEIRVRYFRARQKEYHVYTKPVAAGVVRWAIQKGAAAVIVESDCVSQEKRQWLEDLARELKVKVKYVRVFADPDVAIERLIRAKYNPRTDLLIDNVAAVREMWRLTPAHYMWYEKPWPRFELKRLPVKFLAEIDTTQLGEWRSQVDKVAKKIRGIFF